MRGPDRLAHCVAGKSREKPVELSALAAESRCEHPVEAWLACFPHKKGGAFCKLSVAETRPFEHACTRAIRELLRGRILEYAKGGRHARLQGKARAAVLAEGTG